jgi:solute carrier family 25 S-adenosylmethionine transporter 26
MYPIDTIKTRLQMTQSTAFRLTGLYKGVVGSLVGQVPYGVLTFGSYEIYKQILHERFPTIASNQPAIIYAASAILGDITGSGWLCPSEVIKQQLQAGIYTNTLDAIRGIYSTGGGLKGFYKGYTGGLARDVPFRVAQLTTFEITKRFYLRTKQQQQQRQQRAGSSSSSRNGKSSTTEESESLSALEAAACGAIAGSLSAAITNPLDRIKTLMMTDVTNVYGGSVFSCAQQMVRNDGLIGGLFTGVIPRVVYIAPSVCIFFVTYELVQQKLMTPTKKVSSS